MRLVTGPLQTGLYITELVEGPGKYAAVKSDLSKFTLTNDSQSNGAQWFLESMGNDVYRTMSKDLNVAVTHDAKQGTVGVGKGPTEWTIKETDVPGVYRSVVSLLTFTFNETRLEADPSDAQTYTSALK
ncbi:hypothetical protein F5887DRAFT_919951 [Amanita rubescens]|nr:hypothetical protein F5887DRAFT_919951 [Amanita rubescens]